MYIIYINNYLGRGRDVEGAAPQLDLPIVSWEVFGVCGGETTRGRASLYVGVGGCPTEYRPTSNQAS